MTQAYFITGTDTGIGKTVIAASLLRIAGDHGLSTLGLKPVSAGCELTDGQWMNDDAQELMRLSSISPDYSTVNPLALHEAMAPHIAAERAGIKINAADLVGHCKASLSRADFVVIEGAGGWQVPLNDSETMAELAAGIGCPVVMVVGMRLGCINHALLTAMAIRQQGLRLAGWVANHTDPDMVVADENVRALARRIAAPLLGRIPFLANASAQTAASHFEPDVLEQLKERDAS
jgi:dethiobiotin synthetase